MNKISFSKKTLNVTECIFQETTLSVQKRLFLFFSSFTLSNTLFIVVVNYVYELDIIVVSVEKNDFIDPCSPFFSFHKRLTVSPNGGHFKIGNRGQLGVVYPEASLPV
jgi:hypothetical protein